MKKLQEDKGSAKAGKVTPAKEPAKPETPKSRLLHIEQPPGVSMDRVAADMAGAGLVANAGLVMKFSQFEHGELSLTDMVKSLQDSGKKVNTNDLNGAEQMLNAQAASLNAIYAELARRSFLNMGEYIEATERYMRLALKAQAQCRATVETLAAIKNPPIVYAKQANVSNGPQQVNNAPGAFAGAVGRFPAHAETQSPPNKLLEEDRNGRTLMDAGTTGAATTSNPQVEALGALNRPDNE